MSVTLSSTRRGLRIGTALATGIIGILQVQSAQAQSLGDINSNGGATVTTPTSSTMNINLNDASRHIVWNDFNVEDGHTLSYTTADATNPFTALNTVVNGAPVSQILGTITSQNNIAVWLINPQGMVFSDSSSFSGGSLVLSTLSVRDNGEIADILGGTNGVQLGDNTGGPNAASDYPGMITIEAGASITSAGNVGMVSQQIAMNGDVSATGDVALVLGHGVTMANSAASPLSYTVDAGTRLAATELQVGGNITGASVKLLAVTRDAVTDALLRVDSTASLTATAANGTLILRAQATAGGDVDDLVSEGALSATSTSGNIDISADGNVNVAGSVTMAGTGNYIVSGANVTLGDTGTVTHSTQGAATITATDGNVTTASGLTLTSTGDTTITATASNPTESVVSLAGALSVGGSLTVTGDIVTLGNGTTAKIQEASGAVSVTANTGDLTINQNLGLESSGSTISLNATAGDVIVRGSAVADGDLTVTAASDIQIANASGANGYLVSQTGNSSLTATGGSVYLVGASAGDLPSQTGTFGYVTSGDLTLTADGDVYVRTLTAGGALSVTVDDGAGGGALLGAPTGVTANLSGGAIQANAGNVTIKALGSNSSVIIKEAVGKNVSISADNLAAGSISITGTGGAMTLLEGDDATALGTGNQFIGQYAQVDNLSVALTGLSPTVTDIVATQAEGAFDSGFGKANLTAGAGGITATINDGAQLGIVQSSGAINITAGGVLADTVTGLSTTDVTATDGTLAVGTLNSSSTLTLTKTNGSIATEGDELRLGTGTVTAGGATLDSKTSIRVSSLSATSGAISLTATDGDISGQLTGTAGALDLISTGAVLDSAYGSANLDSDDSSVSVTAGSGGVQLGTVASDTSLTVSGKAVSLASAASGGTATIDATQGTLVLGSLGADSTVAVTKAGGSTATSGDELRITGSLFGSFAGAAGGTTVTSSTHLRAFSIKDYATTASVTATAGDIVIAKEVLAPGNVTLSAGRDVQITNYNAGTSTGFIRSVSGAVQIDAGRSVYAIGGSDSALPAAGGTTGGYHVLGNLTVDGNGDILADSLSATGTITFNLNGSLYGGSGTSGASLPGGAVFGATGVTVNALGSGGVNVLNRAEVTGGNLILKGDKIGIGTPFASGTTSYLDLANNPINPANLYVGITTISGDYTLTATSSTGFSNLIAVEDISGLPAYGTEKFEASLGKTDLTAGSAIGGTISGAAQLGNVNSGDGIILSAGALVADSFTVAVDGLQVTATTGTLSILDAVVSGAMILTKQGGSILTAGDDLRVLTASTGGSITLNSSTSIRVGSINSGSGGITLTATNGDISGMRTGTAGALGTVSTTPILSANYDEADLVSGGAITATANNGAIQLGTVDSVGAITADAKAFGATQLTATGGAFGIIDVATTSGSLNVGSTSASGTTLLDKDGANGDLRFTTLAGPGITLNSESNIIGTTISGTGGHLSIGANNDITIDTIGADSISAVAQHDANYLSVTALNTTFTSAFNDITVGTVTSNSGAAQVRAGRNVTVTGSISGATIGEGWAGIIDANGVLTAPSITSTASAIARSGGDANVGVLSGGSSATVNVGGDYSGTSITSTLGAISLTAGGDVAFTTGTATTGISGTVGSLHAGTLTVSGGNVSLTASTGDIAGKFISGTPGALPTTSANTTLSADYGKLDITASGTVTLTANSGAMQLGTVQSGGALTADALAFAADSLTATGPTGTIDVAVTSGSLNLGTSSAASTTLLTKTGTNGNILFNSVAGPGVTIDSTTSVVGTLINGGATGAVQVDADVDMNVGTILGNTINAVAQRDATFGLVQGQSDTFVGGVRDLLVDTVISNTGAAQAYAGRNATISTRLQGATLAEGFGGFFDPTGTLTAALISSPNTANAISGGNANVTQLTGNLAANVNVQGSYSGTSITSSSGTISLTAGGDVAFSTGTAQTGISGSVGSLHAGSLVVVGGNVNLTATSGDIAGLLIETPGALPTTTTGTTLSSDYGQLNVLATGTVNLTAANGAMQLGTISSGGTITGSARALTIANAVSGGNVALTATSGTLYAGLVEAGLDAILTKTGAGDELRFGTIESGMLVGGASGATLLTSSTNIRGTSVTAHGGPIDVQAANGEVTGLSGGRLALSALPDLDGLAQPIANTDSSVTVVSGLLSRLGDVQAGTGISIAAGVLGSATLGGAINMLDATSARGNVTLRVNNDAANASGMTFDSLSGATVDFQALGANSGDVTGTSAIGQIVFGRSENGDINLGTMNGSVLADLQANNGGIIVGTLGAGGAGSIITAGGDVAIGTGTSADFFSINAGNDLAIGSLVATGGIFITAGGDVTGPSNGDLSGTSINITADGSIDLDAVSATAGNLNATAGNATTDGSISINAASATGLIQLIATATGTADDANHNGTLRVGTASAGSTLTLSNVLLGGTLGDVIVDTSATAGTDALFDAADNARIESAAAAGTIAIRAGDAISGAALNSPATLIAGEDLALKSSAGIDLGNASAGDDLILESDTSITVGALSASGTGPDLRSVSFANPAQITIQGSEPNLGASIVVRSTSGAVATTGLLDASGSVTIDAATTATVGGDVQAGLNYTVNAVGNIVLGDASGATQAANGLVSITSTSGSVSDGAGGVTVTSNADGLGSEVLTITALGGIVFANAVLEGGTAGALSDVVLTASNGSIQTDQISAARLIASAATGFTASTAITVGSAANPADPAGGPSTVDIKVANGNIALGAVTASGAGHDISLAASGTIGATTLTAGRAIMVGGATAGLGSGAFTATQVTSSGGSTTIKSASIGITGTTSSAAGLTLEATSGALALNGATSNGPMSLTATGALSANSLTSSGGGISGVGSTIAISGAANSGGPLSLNAAAGDLSLGSATASGAVDLKATGKVTTGAIGAGANAVTLAAADADIGGAITGSAITIANNGAAGNTFRIGDNAAGTGGFALDTAEINRLSAAAVVLDAGTGTGLTAKDVAIGDLALNNASLRTLDLYARQRVDVTGAVTKATGSGLTGLRIGGTSTDTDLASVIRIAATGDGTGALFDLGDAGLELRGARIGMGQDAGFLDLVGIGPNAAATPLDARLMVSNPASSLYNSTALGGTTYQAAGQVVIRANTMVVRYSDFALFQNTGLPGANEGVRLASSTSPVAPALRIIGPASPVGGPFGMFGEINGIRDTGAALLGDAVINVVSVDRTAARINGCLIGSGAGCLTTLAISPILGTFDPVRGSIFFANADFELPFDPLVGTNNDSLFGDVGTFGLEDVPLESIDCSDDKAGAQCGKPNGENK